MKYIAVSSSAAITLVVNVAVAVPVIPIPIPAAYFMPNGKETCSTTPNGGTE